MSEALKEIKREQIATCLVRGQVDLEHLRHFCRTPFGLATTELRARVWPILVGLTPDFYPSWNREP